MRYLVIDVRKLNVMEAIQANGDPMVWVEVEWGGVRQSSTPIKGRSQLNQKFYFQLAITEKFLKRAE